MRRFEVANFKECGPYIPGARVIAHLNRAEGLGAGQRIEGMSGRR